MLRMSTSTYTRAYIYLYVYKHIDRYINPHTHTHTHTYHIYMYICIHISTYSQCSDHAIILIATRRYLDNNFSFVLNHFYCHPPLAYMKDGQHKTPKKEKQKKTIRT